MGGIGWKEKNVRERVQGKRKEDDRAGIREEGRKKKENRHWEGGTL